METSCVVRFYNILIVSQSAVAGCRQAGMSEQYILLPIIIGIDQYDSENQLELLKLHKTLNENKLDY